ncbi:MAG: choice-of-anchor L domain-containing protein [Acetivibrionales bacterium]
MSALIEDDITNDAAVLEFDFVPEGDVVSFMYVFASDEYNEYVYKYNDVFGFFLNGENVALIPGTNTPVSINNVNGGNPYGGENASYPQYYINNDLDDNGGSVNTEMDGLTKVLTVEARVNPNEINHIKLAIADALDSAYDSVVFIKAGSFSGKPLEYGMFNFAEPTYSIIEDSDEGAVELKVLRTKGSDG